MVAFYGGQMLAKQSDIRGFTHAPSIASSLKFLRRTPWVRERIGSLDLDMPRRARAADGGHTGSGRAGRRLRAG
ncbi:VF530 family DNA-binding protein [Azospira restricta]|uniref:VF530 family DNA-binding protein n=1 Tax=Azospira restricta TaxID=404405 RepID=UPI0030842FFC